MGSPPEAEDGHVISVPAAALSRARCLGERGQSHPGERGEGSKPPQAVLQSHDKEFTQTTNPVS